MSKKLKRKIKRNYRKNKNTFLIVSSILVILLLFFSIKGMFKETPTTEQEKEIYEITETDLFSLKDFTSDQISVQGLRLGQRTQDILEILGSPDIKKEYFPDIVNFEYGESIGLNETGVIIHTESGFVTKITFKPHYNEKLKGETKVDYEKKKIYNIFGKPDKISSIPMAQNSVLLLKVINYNKQGLEFTMRKNKVLAFSLILA